MTEHGFDRAARLIKEARGNAEVTLEQAERANHEFGIALAAGIVAREAAKYATAAEVWASEGLPLDPSKVKAGDTVTLLVDPPDRHPAFTVAGETHSLGGSTVYVGGWRVDDLPDYVTLTDHQPAPEPEPKWTPGTVADVEVWGGTELRAIATNEPRRWRGEDGNTYTEAGEVTNVRPLVVIDPAAVDVDLLAETFLGSPTKAGHLRDALAHLGIEAP